MVVDPRGRLAKEETAVSTRGTGSDAAALDEDDAVAALSEEPRNREARDSPADDDRVGGQLPEDSPSSPDFFLRQKSSAPPTAPRAATIAAVFGTNREPLRLAGTAALAFRFIVRLANGFAAL
jgi:hypothetical protein